MKPGNGIVALAWRQLRRDLAAGDVRILIAALVLAVLAVTAVGFVTDRAERALAIEANRLLGGDAVVRADSPIVGAVRDAANVPALQRTETIELQTMIRTGERLQLGDLRALGEGFPLCGTFRIVDGRGAERDADGVPARGTVWMSRAGADTLGAKLGDEVSLGDARLRLAALVVQEPDAALDYFNVAPKVFLNLADVPATGLVQTGSRVWYYLYAAGTPEAVAAFESWVRGRLARGQQVDNLESGRPEVRASIERAQRFLGLTALLAAILAGVAIALATRRFVERHYDACAVMRCLGATQQRLLGLYGAEFLLLGVAASLAGWDAARKDPAAAAAAVVEQFPSANQEQILKQLQVDLELLCAPGAKSLGQVPEANWQRTYELLTSYLELPKDHPITDYYTTDFLPESPPACT